MLPNTFIAGAQKSGTTTLCNALNSHPHVVISSPKEPAFFTKEANLLRPETYEACFRAKNDEPPAAIIDGSNAYMVNPSAASRIRTMLGVDLRFVFCLRNPVQRTISGYWHQFKKGNDRRPLSDALTFESSCLEHAVEEEQERLRKAVVRGLIDASYYADSHDDALWNFRYFRNSLYSADLIRFSKNFSPERVKVLLFEELTGNPLQALLQLANFLGLDPDLFPSPIDVHRNLTMLTRSPGTLNFLRRVPGREMLHRVPRYEAIKSAFLYRRPPAPDKRVEDRLDQLVEPEVRRLERMLKRDLTGPWCG